MKNKNKVLAQFFALVFLLVSSGCAGTVKNMQVVPPEKIVDSPEQGKSMVVFMRPSSFGAAIQSSVFEIVNDKPSLVGIVAAKKKVSYQLEPGEHLFMVVGESADFMSADLEANKTYYALVTPRMGWWKARFSLKPVHKNSPDLMGWLEDCEWVEKNTASENWASSNMPSIESKHKEYYEKWMSKDLSERPRLF
jgi:hypothetical protein